MNRLTKETRPYSTIYHNYDAAGNRLTMNDASGTFSYVYDKNNRLIEYSDPSGKTLYYQYDSAGNRLLMKDFEHKIYVRYTVE